MLSMISVFLNLLRLILWPNILENGLCVFEENVSSAVGRTVLCMSESQSDLMWSLISMFPYCFSVIVGNGVLKSRALIVLLFLPSDVNICFIYLYKYINVLMSGI